MRDAARRAGCLLQVGLLNRSIAAYRHVKQVAEASAHGRLLSVSTWRLGSYLHPDAPDHKTHYSDPTTELMTFDLDFIGWVMGRPDRITASATAWGDGWGEVSALLGYDDGRTAAVLASGVMPASVPFRTGFRAVFERAAFETETVISEGEVAASTRLFLEDREVPPNIAGGNPYQVELDHFIACIRGPADPALLDADRALEALDLSLKVRATLNEPAKIR